MARVLALVPDLLFGSNVVGALRAAGHDVELRAALAGPPAPGFDALVLDLTAEVEPRIAAVQALGASRPPVLAFYSHVEADVRAAGEKAGFERVVPRSRMAREGAALLEGLL